MRIVLEAVHHIDAPPPAVFALATDPDRFPAVFAGCGPIPAIRRISAQTPAAVGSTRQLANSDGSRLGERITVLDPPHRHGYQLYDLPPPLRWLVRAADADWAFTPAAAGTRVAWRYRWELTGPHAWPIAGPLLHGFMRTAMRRCLAAIARELQTADARRS